MVRPKLARWGTALCGLKPLALFGKPCMGLAERMQDLSHNYHPYRIRRLHPNLMERIAQGVSELIEDPDALWCEMYEGFTYDRYADKIERVAASDFNDPRLLAVLGTCKGGDILFSGGGLLPRPLLEIPGVRWIHIHTGFLPHVRGADVLLWSLLIRSRIGVSAFVMQSQLDAGDIIAAREFAPIEIRLPPGPRLDSTTLYRAVFSFIDPLIRSEFLITDVIGGEGNAIPKGIPQDANTGRTYHFMHPTLRFRALSRLFLSSDDPGGEAAGSLGLAQSYQDLYLRPTLSAHVRLLADVVLCKPSLQRLALSNRRKDYRAVCRNPVLLRLQGDFNRELTRQQECWPSYDYGQGWFYQSSDELGITGLRDSAARLDTYGLGRLVAGRTILEVGCNSGFLSLAIARYAQSVCAFDLNPHLISIALMGQQFLHVDNVTFSVSSFEDFSIDQKFDDVISFANHTTYDRNTKQNLDDYFARCHALIRTGGRLLFESHPPEIESTHFGSVLVALEKYFEIDKSEAYQFGTFLDRNRIYLIATRRERREQSAGGLTPCHYTQPIRHSR
jgi:2-polyprenyl-3-methyl-5-hydroxy-6-metoxy-1,4-benzoquinol methylase